MLDKKEVRNYFRICTGLYRISKLTIYGAILSLLTLNSAFSYTISGVIADIDGNPVIGIAVDLTNGASMPTATNDSGYYQFQYLYEDIYTVTPWDPSYIFIPECVTYSPLISDTVQDFLAARIYSIKGHVRDDFGDGIKGVTVNLSGDRDTTIIIGTEGYYRFGELPPGGYYEVTPFKLGWVFTPPCSCYSQLDGDLTIDFLGTHDYYSIQGYITQNNGSGIDDVIIKFTGVSTIKYDTTKEDGQYELNWLLPETCKVTPYKSGWEFTPQNISYYPLDSRKTGQNFIGQEVALVKVWGGERGYINPTKNEVAKILFTPAIAGEVNIKIYTLSGELVWEKAKVFVAGQEGESQIIEWNCRNENNEEVASGIYLVYIKGIGIDAKKKIAVLK